MKLDSVRALRGIAALLVLIFHIYELQRLWLQTHAPDMTLTAGPWAQGYAGVDLFFVISGFIMVWVTAENAGGIRQAGTFLKRRAGRIFPLWWVFCAILMLYYMATLGAPVSDDYSGNNPAGFLLKSVLLIPQSSEPILGLGWTLVHEIWFYMIFALILWLAPRRILPALLIWGVAVIALALIIPASAHAGSYPKLAASWLSLEFIAGGLAAYMLTRKIYIAPRAIFYIAAAAVIAALCLNTSKDAAQLLWGRVAVFTLPFAALIYGAVALEITRKIKLPRALLWLGDISYSLYLSHILVLGVIVRLWPRLPVPGLDAGGIIDTILFAVAGITASLLTAAIFYYGAERPLLKVTRR